ncbi:hypothetical protein C1H76_9540 [Elsinoe australis]|uniref:Pyrroloquinoline quinone-dependent pyranose dehydrogenase beta-propeller domain-containing protein n=1 Tax=Elsinoe australis TaxID=40998 RepID=A0A4V6DT65_9PEZI|nr:hypothetical protein C1H76_9540 [Elsinoe australis]
MLRNLLLAALPYLAAAQSSSSDGPAPSGSIRPSIASGYRYQVVATGLSGPRGLALDRDGNLLVVEQGRGRISAHSLSDDAGGCVSIRSSTDVTPDGLQLNHGIEISPDGNTLYASNTNETYAWSYDTSARTVSNRQTLVGNMSGTDHSTRTLLLSKSAPDMLIVAFGSTSNYDALATSIDTGSASVKAFNLTNRTETYTYQTDGLLLGWGLRNEVGVGEHPNTGGIWGVENSADQMMRYGVDIHANNPAEELNFLGYLNGTESPTQGTNFGYPFCFSAWNVSELPQNEGIEVGDQFAIDAVPALQNRNETDQFCANRTQARLVFEAHMAPLDIKFNSSGREAWITFHGSWNSPDPVGYKLSMVSFNEAGDPVEPLTSTTAAMDIFANQDNSGCPGNCFRPATMAIDARGRIFMSSDASGEIYLITRDATATGTSPGSGSGSGSGGSGTGTGSGASPSPTTGAGVMTAPQFWCAAVAVCLALFMVSL